LKYFLSLVDDDKYTMSQPIKVIRVDNEDENPNAFDKLNENIKKAYANLNGTKPKTKKIKIAK
jgi:hypothetical protein